MSLKNTLNYLQFFKEVGKSKRLLRSGWIREGIKDPESVAEHSFRVGVLIMVLADKFDPTLNRDRLIKMALLHDLGKPTAGDVIAERGQLIDIKKRDLEERKEREGIGKIFSKINQSGEYVLILNEMMDGKTPEAKIFWQLDKLETVIQALEYENEQEKNLEEFFLNFALYHARDPLIKEIFKDVLRNRKKEYQESLRKKLEGKI